MLFIDFLIYTQLISGLAPSECFPIPITKRFMGLESDHMDPGSTLGLFDPSSSPTGWSLGMVPAASPTVSPLATWPDRSIGQSQTGRDVSFIPRHDTWDCHRTADQARGG